MFTMKAISKGTLILRKDAKKSLGGVVKLKTSEAITNDMSLVPPVEAELIHRVKIGLLGAFYSFLTTNERCAQFGFVFFFLFNFLAHNLRVNS